MPFSMRKDMRQSWGRFRSLGFKGWFHLEIILLKNNFRWLLLAIGWFILSTVLLTLPGSKFPKEDWLSKIWFDKWVHIFLFAVLTWLWCMVVPRQLKNLILAGILCLAYGIIMEFIQGYCIPNRSFDEGDIIADAVGCLIAVVYCRGRYIKK